MKTRREEKNQKARGERKRKNSKGIVAQDALFAFCFDFFCFALTLPFALPFASLVFHKKISMGLRETNLRDWSSTVVFPPSPKSDVAPTNDY